MADNIVCSVIVPLYNEELVLGESYRRMKEVMDSTNESYEIIYINDGSRDTTFEKVEKICLEDPNVKLINFSRNFGHQMAITAGMDYASGNAIVIIDADLQDPPELIPKMLNVWKQGYDVVYGKRLKRKGETFFKKMTAKTYYRILKSMTTVDIPVDTGDFRLMDRKVCEALKSLPEKNRYVRGLVSWVGFKQTALEYERDERFAGETKYPLKKMFKLAYDGIAGFSYKPLKFAAYIGTVVSLVSFISLIVIIIKKIIFPGSTIWGWSSLMVINLFFNGLVLIMLGVIGEYIGRIYDEAKGRPMYIVASKKGFKEK